MDTSQNHYWTYHGLPALLACKRPITASKDEDLFIAVHQVCEIAFHQMIMDLRRTLDALREDDFAEAVYFGTRVLQFWATVNTTMPILNGLRAFAEFRTAIGPTSGFQSVQFRHIEILSGVPRDYWRGGTADASGTLHVAETEFDARHGDDVRRWLDEHREHNLRFHWRRLRGRLDAADARHAPLLRFFAAYEAAQRRFHRAHLALAIVQLRKVGADVGTGGTSFRDYLATYEREVAPLFEGLPAEVSSDSTSRSAPTN